MRKKLILLPPTLFNAFQHVWELKLTQRIIGIFLSAVLLGALILISLKSNNMLPEFIAVHIPSNHFQAVTLAFNILLITEVIGLILIIGTSMSRSVGRELEIMALIMVRNVFKALNEMGDPINPTADKIALAGVAAQCLTALLIFIVAGVYKHIQSKKCPGSEDAEPRVYIIAKKSVALVLLALFIFDGGAHLLAAFNGSSLFHEQADFFARFYTMLIFADLFLLLASESSMHNPTLLFRNSGYIAGAVFMRLALGAPHLWDAVIASFAALYILAISYAVLKLRLNCKI